MAKRLSRTYSAPVCGPTFLAAVMLLVKGVPILGNFIYVMLLWSSPILSLQVFCRLLSMHYFPNSSPPPTFFWTAVVTFFGLPPSWADWAAPFAAYGLVQGFIYPLKSGTVPAIAKSIAIRFLVTLLAAVSVGIWGAAILCQ